MFTFDKTKRFETKFIKVLIVFSLLVYLSDCYQSAYEIGYIDGYRDAERELSHSQRHIFRGHRTTSGDEELEEDEGPNDYEQRLKHIYGKVKNKRRRQIENYATIFGVDDQVLSRSFQKVSGSCLQKIKPLFGSCIEMAVNKFDLETEGTLGVNNCKALWFLMCCSTDLVLRQCGRSDSVVIGMGFSAIQKTLELKECAKVPRNNVDCPPISIHNYMTVVSADGTVEESGDAYENPEEPLKTKNYMTVVSADGTIEESADPYEAPDYPLSPHNYMTVESADGTIEESADPYEAPDEANLRRRHAPYAPHASHLNHVHHIPQHVYRRYNG